MEFNINQHKQLILNTNNQIVVVNTNNQIVILNWL